MEGESLLVSVITVCYNSAGSIINTINSVNSQSYSAIEHIFVDGASVDNTLALVKDKAQRSPIIISEPDRGIYDAMNKGVALASGEIVCFLNSDDCFFTETVISNVVECFSRPSIDFVYGDIEMINCVGEVIRYWRTGPLNKSKFFLSQVPHPAFFVRRTIINSINPPFDINYRIAADLKQQLIIHKLKLNYEYLTMPLVRMAIGGESTRNLSAYINGWYESSRAFNDVFGHFGIFFATQKVLRKILGLKLLSLIRNSMIDSN